MPMFVAWRKLHLLLVERKHVHEKYSMLLKEEINKNPISEPAELLTAPTNK